MSGEFVFDASALLALLNQESGHEQVEKHLSRAVMSAVNVSETISILVEQGMPVELAEQSVHDLISTIISFNYEQALEAAILRKDTKRYGLSLGERACLALAKLESLPVLTADKIWAKLHMDVEVKVIR